MEDLQIEGRHIEVAPEWAAEIKERVNALQKGHSDLIHVRVTITRQRHHKRADDTAEAVIVATMPARHTITARKREETVEQAIRSAFEALEVELKRVREKRASREVGARLPAEPVRGVISKLYPDEGYGFIQPETGEEEVYFHRNAVHDMKFAELTDGMEVSFNVEEGDNGPQATTVNPVPTIKVAKGES